MFPTTPAQWQAAALGHAAREAEKAVRKLAAGNLLGALAAHISAASLVRGVIAERDAGADLRAA